MGYMTIFLLYLTAFTARISGEVAERDTDPNFSGNPAAVFRYASFPSIVGHQLYSRQEGCGCQVGGKWLVSLLVIVETVTFEKTELF